MPGFIRFKLWLIQGVWGSMSGNQSPDLNPLNFITAHWDVLEKTLCSVPTLQSTIQDLGWKFVTMHCLKKTKPFHLHTMITDKGALKKPNQNPSVKINPWSKGFPMSPERYNFKGLNNITIKLVLLYVDYSLVTLKWKINKNNFCCIFLWEFAKNHSFNSKTCGQ